jgi:ABC-type sugar transport system ATPase subunit
MSTVLLKNVTKTFDTPPRPDSPRGVPAVRDVSLEVRSGELLVLVGPSGSGKSTVLRLIAGLEEPEQGEISIGDRLVTGVRKGKITTWVEPKDRDIAMVFQNYALYPHMSVYDNLAFGLKMRKTPREEIKQRVAEAARVLGIEALLARKPRQLSGGERQRVALGRAIVRHPQVFLFDEPLSNLDASLRVGMRAEIKRLHARLATTAIYVTHDQVEAMTLGDRIAVMKEGRILQLGTPLELYGHPANLFVATFIGSPPMNLLRGRLLVEGGVSFSHPALKQPLAVPSPPPGLPPTGSEVILGIRPEHIFLSDSGTPPVLTAAVEVVEPVGAETVLFVRQEDTRLVLRLPGIRPLAPGSPVSLSFDTAHLAWFDPASEKALG